MVTIQKQDVNSQAGALNKLQDLKRQNPNDKRNLQIISISEMKGAHKYK
jgi:hypothetical protein